MPIFRLGMNEYIRLLNNLYLSSLEMYSPFILFAEEQTDFLDRA